MARFEVPKIAPARLSCSHSPGVSRLLKHATRHRTAIALLALGLVVLALYGRTLGGYFLADDFAYLSVSHSYSLSRVPAMFFRDENTAIWGYSLGLLRPLYALSGIIQERLFHGDAGGYRMVTVTLHAINVWLVFALARKVLAHQWLAFGGALLFAVHPIHAETLAWIGGQSDLLPTAMFLGATLSFLAYREQPHLRHAFLTTALTAAAVFTKENAVVLPVVFAAYDALHFSKERWERSGAACSPVSFTLPRPTCRARRLITTKNEVAGVAGSILSGCVAPPKLCAPAWAKIQKRRWIRSGESLSMPPADARGDSSLGW